MMILALDLSLNRTGVAAGLYDLDLCKLMDIDSYIIETKKIKDHMSKICRIKKVIGNYIKQYNPKRIMIEGQSYASRGRATLSIAQLHGVIMYACKKIWKIKYKLIPPTTVKKCVTGKGNSKKSMVMKSLYKKFDIDVDDEDKADAIAVLITGAADLLVSKSIGGKNGRKKR